MNGETATDILRRIEQLLRLGTIAQVDHAAARCRVRSGELLSTWVPWIALRAGTTTHWSPPTVGEQCVLMSPGGDTAAAVALLGLYSTAAPAPSAAPDLHCTHYADGAVISYDQASHSLAATLPSGSSATLTATHVTVHAETITLNGSGGATINADTTLNGHLTHNGSQTVSGDVVASGISLVGHKHGGVQGGTSKTGAPE